MRRGAQGVGKVRGEQQKKVITSLVHIHHRKIQIVTVCVHKKCSELNKPGYERSLPLEFPKPTLRLHLSVRLVR